MKNQIKKTFIAISLLGSMIANAQQRMIQPCDTYAAMENYFSSNAEAKARYERSQNDFNAFCMKKEAEAKNNQSKTAAVQYTVPVVFHVLHTGGPENVSDAQIMAALDQVNKDFAAASADFSSIFVPFQALYINSDIKFMLARKDPNGNCTNGIIHRYDSRTIWDRNPPSSAGNPALYAGITWNPTKYLNVILVKDIVAQAGQQGQVIGYTWLPGTWLSGADQDAIVYNSGSLGGYDARSLTHEIGHWLNLAHTFGSTNNPGVTCGSLSGGDNVSDTPDTKGDFSTCPPSSTNTAFTCTSPNPTNTADYYSNVENFMNYSSCPRNFTTGQTNRMRNALQSATASRSNLWSTTNLAATDVNNVIPCVPIAEYYSSTGAYTVCSGGSLSFKDVSWNAPITNYQWTGDNGAVFSAPTASATNASFPNVGVSNVTLTVSNSQGSSTQVRPVTVINSAPGAVGTFTESFENGPVPTGWTVVNNNVGSAEWEQTYNASLDGSASFYIDGSNMAPGQSDYLQMPVIDVLNSSNNKVFTFAYAYAQYDASTNDELRIQGSKDCGGTWNNIVVLSGSQMQAGSGGILAAPYAPSSPGEWKTYTLSNHPNWNSYKTSTSVMIRFNFLEGTQAHGNNIYIDAINYGSGPGSGTVVTTAINEFTKNYAFNVYPNPAIDETTVSFNLNDVSHVKLSVLDVVGKEVITVVDSKLAAGQKSVSINENGSLPSGIYFINLSVNGSKMTTKLIVN